MIRVTIKMPIPVKQFVLRKYGKDPVEFLSLISEKEYKIFKFSVDHCLGAEENEDYMDILIPTSLNYLFENSKYHYQVQSYFKELFHQALFAHITGQQNVGVGVNASIVDFFQTYNLDECFESLVTIRQRFYRAKKTDGIRV